MTRETDTRQQAVQALVDAMSDSGEKAVPMATTDTSEVIKSQLTENTGRHLLDSGGAYGRNWEENRENPPWEKPRWTVGDGYVIQNVYHFMDNAYGRDSLAVALEIALYAFGYSDERARQSWLATMKDFGEALETAPVGVWVEEYDLPPDVANEIATAGFGGATSTFNSYNSECGDLSQVLQGTMLGDYYAEYGMVQVHGGADVRGGYTAPRVYRALRGTLMAPGEYSYYCDEYAWQEAESCVYDDPDLIYVTGPADYASVEDELRSAGRLDDVDEAEIESAVERAAVTDTNGAVFRIFSGGRLGHVQVH